MSVERELLIVAVEWLHDLKYMWADTRDPGDMILLELIADINKIEKLLAQPEQEPVATKLESHQFTAFHVSADDFKKLQKLPTGTKIYTSPPKREPLSDEAVCQILLKKEWKGFVDLVRIIEKAHGIGGGV